MKYLLITYSLLFNNIRCTIYDNKSKLQSSCCLLRDCKNIPTTSTTTTTIQPPTPLCESYRKNISISHLAVVGRATVGWFWYDANAMRRHTTHTHSHTQTYTSRKCELRIVSGENQISLTALTETSHDDCQCGVCVCVCVHSSWIR